MTFPMSIAYALQDLKLHNIRTRRYDLHAEFLIQVYFGSKFYPSSLKSADLRVPARYIQEFSASALK
jgi:hypothetical protein